MKNLIAIILIIAFSASFSKAQVIKDTIKVKKHIFGTIYLKDGKSIGNGRGLSKLLSSNPETHADLKLVNTNWVFSAIFGGASGFIFGYQLASSYTRSSPNWGALSAATALLGLSIPFEIGRVKHINKAVSIYNNGLRQTSRNNLQYNLRISNNGVGLKVSF
ncbi:hypothetical protein [Pedobacter alpinus]|uniref:Outer membrane protein beta-barrel domain-containing protein n=1 Tax=Pedobacter alpinus TaxID=1590643 RepID=A0ABW5TMD0_9SPHI